MKKGEVEGEGWILLLCLRLRLPPLLLPLLPQRLLRLQLLV